MGTGPQRGRKEEVVNGESRKNREFGTKNPETGKIKKIEEQDQNQKDSRAFFHDEPAGGGQTLAPRSQVYGKSRYPDQYGQNVTEPQQFHHIGPPFFFEIQETTLFTASLYHKKNFLYMPLPNFSRFLSKVCRFLLFTLCTALCS